MCIKGFPHEDIGQWIARAPKNYSGTVSIAHSIHTLLLQPLLLGQDRGGKKKEKKDWIPTIMKSKG